MIHYSDSKVNLVPIYPRINIREGQQQKDEPFYSKDGVYASTKLTRNLGFFIFSTKKKGFLIQSVYGFIIPTESGIIQLEEPASEAFKKSRIFLI